MISRVLLTLALASSVALTATDKEKEFKLGARTKLVAGLAITAAAATFATGVYKGNWAATPSVQEALKLGSMSVGLLTGLGCAAVEDYAQTIVYGRDNNKLLPIAMPLSYMAEIHARQHSLVFLECCTPDNLYNSPQAQSSQICSWASYLAYHGARYLDNN